MKKSDLTFWVYILPALFLFVTVILIPIFLGIYYSFTNWTAHPGIHGLKFIGLENYGNCFGDIHFLYSSIITFAYAAANIICINVIAFLLALLVTSGVKGGKVYQAGFFLPNLIGGLVLGFIWQFIFNIVIPNFPLLSTMIPSLASPENLILAHRDSAFWAIVIAGTWQYAGYIMMIYIAAIIGVPEELYEAAEIDGASSSRKLFTITIPMTAQAFTITLFLTLIHSFKQFDTNVSLTNGGPSTQFLGNFMNGTELLALNIYNTAFESNKFAQSQAQSVIFFLVLAGISLLQVKYNKKKEVEL